MVAVIRVPRLSGLSRSLHVKGMVSEPELLSTLEKVNNDILEPPASSSTPASSSSKGSSPQEIEDERQAQIKALESTLAIAKAHIEEQEKALAAAAKQAESMGYSEGVRRGEQEMAELFSTRIESLERLLSSLEQERDVFLKAGEDALVEVVFTAVTKILGEKAVSQEGVFSAVRQAITQMERGRFTVHVAPAHFEDLALALSNENVVGFELHLVPDARVQYGGCIIENDEGGLDARLDVQMARLREVLLDARRSD